MNSVNHLNKKDSYPQGKVLWFPKRKAKKLELILSLKFFSVLSTNLQIFDLSIRRPLLVSTPGTYRVFFPCLANWNTQIPTLLDNPEDIDAVRPEDEMYQDQDNQNEPIP